MTEYTTLQRLKAARRAADEHRRLREPVQSQPDTGEDR